MVGTYVYMTNGNHCDYYDINILLYSSLLRINIHSSQDHGYYGLVKSGHMDIWWYIRKLHWLCNSFHKKMWGMHLFQGNITFCNHAKICRAQEPPQYYANNTWICGKKCCVVVFICHQNPIWSPCVCWTSEQYIRDELL